VSRQEAFVEANEMGLHYFVWKTAREGNAASPPLVLIHATGFLARLWQPVAERLAERFDVYAFDMRGHGDSDKPEAGVRSQEPGVRSQGRGDLEDSYHWRHLVDDLRGFLDALGLRGVSIVGHSSGGAAATYLAATRPEYVSRLALFEPIIFPEAFTAIPEERRNDMAEGARRRRMVWSNPEEIIATYRTRPTFERWRADILRLYAEEGTFRREDGHVELKCSGEIEAAFFDNSRSLDTWERLPDVRCPTLVMSGALTHGPFPALMDQVAARIPNARTVTIPAAGHLAPMERPEAVADVVLTFAEETSWAKT
jgi:pimeloyl-ACP methyl ester carboxylesterase